jgi:hypothetical protein
MVLWSLDVRDWEYRDAGMLAARVKAGAGPAMVVLLHATYEWTATALPEIIAALRGQGCRFVTLSDWLAFMHGQESQTAVAAETPARPIPIAHTTDAPAATAPMITPAVVQEPAAAPLPPPAAPLIAQAPAAAPPPPAPAATPPRWTTGPAPAAQTPAAQMPVAQTAPAAVPAQTAPPAAPAARAAAKPAPTPAARPTPAVTLRPAKLEKRNNKTEVRIEGDDMFLSLGPDADIDAIAAQVKEALERPRLPKP